MLYRSMQTSSRRCSFAHLADRDLIAETLRLADHERHATADVIAALMEIDARKLFLGEGCSSLFTYCTQVLRFSEHAAYGRIEAARAAHRFPAILDQLAGGHLTLTAVSLLAPHLTPDHCHELLEAARHKTKREVEHIVAAIRPLPAVAPVIRKLPSPRANGPAVLRNPTEQSAAVERPSVVADEVPRPAATRATPGQPAAIVSPLAPEHKAAAARTVVTPLSVERYKLQVTLSRETHDKLRHAQDLLRHCIPDGDPAAVLDRALTLLVADLEKKKLAAAARPRPTGDVSKDTRHVPAAVRRAVWARDEGRCAFVGTQGRCTERGFLELHHVVPFADGGATDTGNLELRCRAHNAYEAEQWFGPPVVRERQAAYQTSICIFNRRGLGPDRVRPTIVDDGKVAQVRPR